MELPVADSGPFRVIICNCIGAVSDFGRSHGSGKRGDYCSSNLKQIGLGLLQYTQDYDEKFPPAASSADAYGWANAVQPYVRSTQLFQCPQETSAGQRNFKLTGYTDYFFR